MRRFAKIVPPALWSLLLTGLAATAGCDDHDHDHDHGSEPKDVHACEHVESGPEAAVTASVDRAGAPEGFEAHTLVVATLADIDGGKGGFLTLTLAEAGEYRLLLTAAVPVAILPEGGATAVAPESTGDPDGCDAAAQVQVFDLPAGAHTLSVGPTTEGTLSFVLELQEDHDHDDHDH